MYVYYVIKYDRVSSSYTGRIMRYYELMELGNYDLY